MNRPWAGLLETLEQRPLSDPVIQKSFRLLNEMCSSEDSRVVDLAAVGVIEMLTDTPASIRAARQLLYGCAIDEFEGAMRLWGIDAREP